MIFKKMFLCAFFAVSFSVLAQVYKPENGITATLRPVLLRSEFASSGTIRNLQKFSELPGYNMHGFPEFKNIIIERKLQFWETRLAQTRSYTRYLNRLYKTEIISHPEIFSAETIRDYTKGLTSRNPRYITGEVLQWHHGEDGYYLILESEHQGYPHTGGNKIWGFKHKEAMEEWLRKNPRRLQEITAQRWGAFVALDLVLSSASLAIQGKKDWQTYAVNTTASASAGFIAWGLESLLITSFPLMQGNTPVFILGHAINLGGPASWIASGTFFLTKYAIMTGWEKHQVQAALEVEESCRYAEKMTRFNIIKRGANYNSQKLLSLIN